MQNIIIDKPYRFVPPYPGRLWTRLLDLGLPTYLRRTWGIAGAEFRGVAHLQKSLAAGHGIILASNHSRPCDPMVVALLILQVHVPFYCLASWHLFMQNRLQGWLMRRLGAYSIYREGMDREALRASIDILARADRPLVLFPEGVVSRTNDCLTLLQEGTAFIARSAARKRAQATPPGQVVIHPVAVKYYFKGNLESSAAQVLDELETRLTWRPQRQLSFVERIHKLGEALLCLKEIEYLGQAQPGDRQQRIAALIDRLLLPLEKEWLGGRSEPTMIDRIKRLRAAILPDMAANTVTEPERARRWQQLSEIYLAQQLGSYPEAYVRSRPTVERILETVERFEEDVTDDARIHRPLRAVLQVGEAVEVSPTRERNNGSDPLMQHLEQRLQGMLDGLAAESPVLAAPGSPSLTLVSRADA